MSVSMTRVALFGTSADPPTVGHQAILRWLSEHYDQVAVWAADNPFKKAWGILGSTVGDVAVGDRRFGLRQCSGG